MLYFLTSQAFINRLYNNIPLYFLAVAVLVFILCSIKDDRINNGILVAAILVCVLMSFLVDLDICIGEYYDHYRSAATLKSYAAISLYVEAEGIVLNNYNFLHSMVSATCYSLRIVYVVLAYYILKGKNKPLTNFLLCLPAAVVSLLFYTSYYTHWCHYYDNIQFFFHTNKGYDTIYIVIAFYLVLLVKKIVAEKYQNRKSFLLLIFLIVSTLTVVILDAKEIIRADIDVVDLTFLMAVVLYFLMIKLNLVNEDIRQVNAKLLESKVELMASQIKPHFIFNCIGNIAELCQEGSPAQSALITFSNYLRTGLYLLNTSKPLPFKSELEHIENYLTLERMRYPDAFKVVYDLKVMNFVVPLISIEVYVENAIKHNIGLVEGLIEVTIKTYEDKDNYYVEIIDNGVGFDLEQVMASDNGVGMKNATYRLEQMVNARVEVKTTPKQGTNVTITLPKK